jgi:uncharacterized protein (DUF305 family)
VFGYAGIRIIVSVLTLAVLGSAVAFAQPWRGGMRGAPAGMPGMSGMPGMAGMMVADEFNFLAGMIPHHQEAIDSATLLLAGTERPELRVLAEEIIRTQTAEIAVLRELLATNYPGRSADAEAVALAYQPMMRDLSGLSGAALDQAFLQDMIHHHMMAVMMSRQVLAVDSAPQTRELALSIIGDQTREIAQMQSWLREWAGAPTAPMGAMMGPGGWRRSPATPDDAAAAAPGAWGRGWRTGARACW